MGYNIVYDSCVDLLKDAKHVDIANTGEGVVNLSNALVESTKRFSLPGWNFPPYDPETTKDTIGIFMLANCLNFCFIDKNLSKETGETAKFTTAYEGNSYSGSNALWVSIRRGHDIFGDTLLTGRFLSELDDETARIIFEGDPQIPMLEERICILRDVGESLEKYHNGSFDNLVNSARDVNGTVHLWHGGRGLVDRLITDFKNFDDFVKIDGTDYFFDKRAQLAPAMLAGRYASLPEDHPEYGRFEVADLDEITVFADYNLPRPLIHFNAVRLSEELAEKIQTQTEIPAHSREEAELRAATVVQWRAIRKKVEELTGEKLTDAHIDGAGFLVCKKWEKQYDNFPKPHFTRTIAY